MIVASGMDLGDAVSLLYARASLVANPHNTDWGEMVRYVQEARRELFVKTSPYKEWAYQATVAVTHQSLLPDDFIRPTRLITRDPLTDIADAIWTEARRVDPREWRNLTSPIAQLSFVRAIETAPVYMIFANNDTTNTWATTPMAVWLWPDTLDGQLDYAASYSLSTLNETTDPLNVPVELEGLLIDMALLRLLGDIANPSLVSSVAKDVYKELAQFQASKTATMVAEAVNIESLPSPSPTQMPPVEQGGR